MAKASLQMPIHERRKTAHLEILHSGAERWNEWRSAHPDEQPDLAQADLRGLDLRRYDLRGADLREASIRGCNFDEADLSRADLTGAFVDESRIIIADPAQRFRRDPFTASFRGCQLGRVRCVWANLQYCDFTGARMHMADFESANLVHACFAETSSWETRFDDANAAHADFTRADIRSSSFRKAYLHGALFDHAIFWGNVTAADLSAARLEATDVTQIEYVRRKLKCRGILAESCYGNALFRRDVQDADWVESFREQDRVHSILYWLWSATTDCGRSFLRIAMLSFVVTIAFGLFYDAHPQHVRFAQDASSTLLSPYYSSIMIFTSFSTGDLLPRSVLGQLAITAEVILGYLTIGLLISILANVVARRS